MDLIAGMLVSNGMIFLLAIEFHQVFGIEEREEDYSLLFPLSLYYTACQIRTTRSQEPETIRVPSGDQEMELTGS
jgi:hypothetical protein